MASSELPPHPVLSNKLPPILKDHTCVSSITLEVSHLTRMSRSWMKLLDDEILAIWVGCNWKFYSDNPGRSRDGAADTTMPVFATCRARTTG